MFSIVAKKTKLALKTASGNMICWRDTTGALWQKTTYKTKNNKTTEEAKTVSSCTLKVPEIIKAGGRTFDVYLIGGGAAGTYYKKSSLTSKNGDNGEKCSEVTAEILSNCVKYNNDDLKKYTVPFKSGDIVFSHNEENIKKLANKYKKDKDLSTASNVGCIDTTSGIGCYLKLYDNKYYSIKKSLNGCSNDILYYASNKQSSGDINTYELNGIQVYDKDVPFIIEKDLADNVDKICYYDDKNESYCKKILGGTPASIDINDNNCKVYYYTGLVYSTYSTPKELTSWVSSKSVQLNLEKDLIIPKANIGAGGTYSTCEGGDTVFPGVENLIAKGQKCNLNVDKIATLRTTQSKDKVINSTDTIPPKVPTLNTALNNSSLLGGHHSYTGRYDNAYSYADETSDSLKFTKANFIYTGSQIDNGFGLFGMQGGSSLCSIRSSYKDVKYNGKTIVKGYPANSGCTTPGTGMGGAIVVIWK